MTALKVNRKVKPYTDKKCFMGMVADERDPEVGQLVKIRPVSDPKTYLGIHIGSIATDFYADLHEDRDFIEVGFVDHNPAIFVPELGRVVFGYESWWSVVESPEQLLATITDADLQRWGKSLSLLLELTHRQSEAKDETTI